MGESEKINEFYNLYVQEHSLLNRLIYKFKNQHGRLGHFRSVFRTNRDLKLFITAYHETFFNKTSTENPEIFGLNVKDLSRISRRIKWDLKDAGISISRLIAHGFHLSLAFSLFSIFSRLYVNTIKLDSVTKSILGSNSNKVKSLPNLSNNNPNELNDKKDSHGTSSSSFEFFGQDEDLGHVISPSENIFTVFDSSYVEKNHIENAVATENIEYISRSESDAVFNNYTTIQDELIQRGKIALTMRNKNSRLFNSWKKHKLLRLKSKLVSRKKKKKDGG
ncbi:hypothetical protein FG379_002446 [Cryptosporidium bovis]|uniref:uncharacterized protein n=1 Tax=Cryptosporidium bovis TaxID=310047 RepID=UPI00351A1909|nr:hypothetical protein FG379_002446 [Cryptosporidium bovis]